jgi:hypothetical protein
VLWRNHAERACAGFAKPAGSGCAPQRFREAGRIRLRTAALSRSRQNQAARRSAFAKPAGSGCAPQRFREAGRIRLRAAALSRSRQDQTARRSAFAKTRQVEQMLTCVEAPSVPVVGFVKALCGAPIAVCAEAWSVATVGFAKAMGRAMSVGKPPVVLLIGVRRGVRHDCRQSGLSP